MRRMDFMKTIYLLAATLFVCACTNDELTDGDSLPEGKYPLQIASVSMSVEGSEQPWGAKSPQTRVSENADGNSSAWSWNGSEQIGVQLYANGDVATYTLNANKTLTADKTIFWRNTQSTTVSAWYPTNQTVLLANQISGLAYVMKSLGTGDYNNAVTLEFSHQLAKVRVMLSGDKANDVENVSIKSYTSCTHNQGTVSKDGASEGWIAMYSVTHNGAKCWEANVVPNQKITQFQINNTTTGTLNDGGIMPIAGAINTIQIDVKQKLTEIDLSTIAESALTVNGNVVLSGTKSGLQITVQPNSHVTLENVNLSYNEGPTIICQGTATITLKGNNKLAPKSKGVNQSLDTSGSGIEMRSNGTLTIESEPNATLAIEKTRTEGPGITPYFGAGIGLYDNANLVIKGGTITVTGGQDTSTGGADIGGCAIKSAGTITIESGTFTLSGRCMNNSLIGKGTDGSCGTVTIRKGVTVNKNTYSQDHVGEIQ